MEFDQCPALRKPHLQEVALFDMVAYKDAIRHHVCIGDKVLAPWQNDGRYGPGTVLDGVDRRDVQPQGKLCMNQANGQVKGYISMNTGLSLIV